MVMRFILGLTLALFIFSCNPGRNSANGKNPDEQLSSKGTNTFAGKQVKKASSGTADNVKTPAFDFEETDFNFGTINEGEIVDHNFKFTNTGNAPLIINRASASCGCTVPSPPKDPILPGQSSEIHVRFNSNNKENQQVKTITIEANTTPAITKLQIHGFIVPKNQKGSSY